MYDIIIDTKNFEGYYLKDLETEFKFLPNANTINIIIGSNNSGKSRFIRNLINYSFKIYKKNDNLKSIINEYNFNIKSINKQCSDKIEFYKKRGMSRDASLIERIYEGKFEEINFDNLSNFEKLITTNVAKKNNLTSYVTNIKNYNIENINQSKFYDNVLNNLKYYIPTLRTSHSLLESKNGEFKKIEDDIFSITYKKNYTIDEKVKLFTGLQLYIDILNARNSDRKTRENFQKFEDFISVNFFNGRQTDIVANFDKRKNMEGSNLEETITIHIQGENTTRKISDIGDGIQALIVLMYQIFMAEDGSYIFIDEPELNLHPGMQRLFLEQISTNKDLKKKNLNYFITTHSNHFLDLTIEKNEVSIYSFQGIVDEKGENKFIIKNVNAGDNSTLRELGVNNSSVFMANCSIWVEGISDRNYIKAFLKSYLKHKKEVYKLKEDIDFAFFEYAGSNIKHYLFSNEAEESMQEIILKDIKALSLNNRIFLLADSDMAAKNSKKWNRLKAFEDQKKENFIPKIIWNIREIENLLSNEIWEDVLIELCNKELLKKHKEEITNRIKKVCSEIKVEKYSKKYIGNYLNEIRVNLGKIEGKDVLNKSIYKTIDNKTFGTLVNKRLLSEIVFERDFSWEIFSKNEEIKILTEEIYEFIKG